MPLTDVTVRNVKPQDKPQKLTDGDGMFLFVHPNGGKYWRMQYRFAGKQKVLALGVYPEVSLADARDRRTDARKVLAAGNDPSEVKKEAKRLTILNSENTFEAIAREWHDHRKHEWVDSHAYSILVRLDRHAFKKLGSRPIADIDAPELLSVFKVVEKSGALNMAQRIMQFDGGYRIGHQPISRILPAVCDHTLCCKIDNILGFFFFNKINDFIKMMIKI